MTSLLRTNLLKTLTAKSSRVILLTLSATAFTLNWITWIVMNLCLNITPPWNIFMTTTMQLYAARRVKHRPCAICFNDEVRAEKREKLRLERKYRKSGRAIDNQLYGGQCVRYNSPLERQKSNFYRTIIENTDCNQLFGTINGMFKVKSITLPTHDSLHQLVEDFNNFLLKKKGEVSVTSLGRPIRPALISGFRSMKRLGVFYSPLDGMPLHRRVTPSIFTGTHLYTWVERGTVRVKCLAQEHNTMFPARTEPGPLDPESSTLTMRPPRLPIFDLAFLLLLPQLTRLRRGSCLVVFIISDSLGHFCE